MSEGASGTEKRRAGLRARLAFFIVGIATALTFLDVCDLLFGCGCEGPWGAGSRHCDIHVQGPPDCPFCTGGDLRFAWITATIVLVEWATVRLLARWTRARFGWLLVAGVAAYLLTATALGGILAAVEGNDRFGAFLRDLPPPQHPQAH